MKQLNLTRRTLLKSTGAAVALAASGLPARAQTPAGMLIVGQIAEPKSLDPAALTAVTISASW